jgi:hypothetical protein
MLVSVFILLISSQVFSQAVKPDFRKLAEQRSGKPLAAFCPVDTDPTAHRLFAEYGAVFIANAEIVIPFKCIFSNEDEVREFQASASPRTVVLDGVSVTLQAPAMEALLKAREKAAQAGLRISPRGGSLAAKRSYEDTRGLWNSRFLPGLNYWVKKGKLGKSEAGAARRLSTEAQVGQVLEWETNRKLFFSKDLSKSILYSVAAPGASQHNFMLAVDVQQFADKRVRAIMAEFGWFQTVKSDLPHFTYLGRRENELSSWGLKQIFIDGQSFWIPDVE